MTHDGDRPLVSVIITTYNRVSLLAETLKSVSAQTFQDFEVIVVDDGSLEDPSEVVLSFGRRFRCVRQVNSGQPAARNHGISLSRGEFIAFLDDDDLWLPEKLRLQVDIMQSNPDLGWCVCDGYAFHHDTGIVAFRFSDRANPATGWVGARLIRGNFIASPSVLARRETVHRAGMFETDPAVRIGEDWLMWMKLASISPMAYIREPLFSYRIHLGAMTKRVDPMKLARAHGHVIRKVVKFAPALYGRLARSGFIRDCLNIGRIAGSQGLDSAAVTFFSFALRSRLFLCESALHFFGGLLGWRRFGGYIMLTRTFKGK